MKVTYNWLKDFVDIDVSPAQLADMLTMAGLEVESMETFGDNLDGIVVSKIVEIKPHPDADKLVICRIDDGTADNRQVVCGATNMKAGDKVPLAKPGAHLKSLKDGEVFKLKKSKLRGVESDGMLCSDVELNLGKDARGLMILPEEMKIGEPIADSLNIRDTVYEVAVMPNRPDIASIIGIAREIGAILNKPVKKIIPEVEETGKNISEWAEIEILDYELCPRYVGRIITGVVIKPSPSWMSRRLERCGVRSINNLVDITNYVLLEMGHPMHAFDYDKLKAHKIIVRRAEDGEEIVTLDDITRKLSRDVLVIADTERAIALAGIMGGGNTEVDEFTKTILLESANFNPSSIRRTSKRLGLQTEASYRFERGADPEIQLTAANRVCELVASTGGGKIQKGAIDNRKDSYQTGGQKVRVSRTNKVLGTSLGQNDIESIFTRLQFPLKESGDDCITVESPSYRVDLEREIDYIEEIARIHGYNNIPTPVSTAKVLVHEENPATRIETLVRESLTAFGLYEVINCNLISETSLARVSRALSINDDSILRVMNPASEEHSVIRPTLIPGILETVERNMNRNHFDLMFFELGHTHQKKDENLPPETMMLSIALSGFYGDETWNNKPIRSDFYCLKGILEELMKLMGVRNIKFLPKDNPVFASGSCAGISVNGEETGILGEIHPKTLRSFGIEKQVYLSELTLEPFFRMKPEKLPFEEPPQYPGISRDIAIIVDNQVTFDRIIEVINSFRISTLEDVLLFDVYRGEQVGAGKKSMALTLKFRSKDRTLTDAEVDKHFGRVREELIKNTGCTVREG